MATSANISALVPAVIHVRTYRPVVASATPSFIGVVLQLGHRLAIVGLLAGLATLGAAAAGRPFCVPLSVAAGCGDIGCAVALLVLSLVLRPTPAGREAVGLLAFNSVLATASLALMLVARFDVLHADLQSGGSAARAAVTQFFTPPAELPPGSP